MGKEVISRMKSLLVAISMCLLVVSVSAVAQTDQIFVAADTELVESVETFQFRSSAEQRRAIELSRRLRCPQCQNQNLIESNSPVAKDLRLKVYQMVNDGDSDEDVIEYMTSRFGDFVLYKPRLNPQTYLLWGGPFLLLGLFGSIIWVTIRRQQRAR
ncbi:heme lyase NrfEFG subunit NrfF [Photobacterium satsumensis]|uniref:heme lyase NrfEFG subunit NrfF n=1 Tax=Photobacterium satsumensis TaxID=2910239 RepID=UPI003D13629A